MPPEPAPRPLRRLLGHARLTPAALATIRKVVDEDEAFRARVADFVTENAVGRASWLFLARPAGWEDEVAGLAAASEAEAMAAREGREERVAARRLKGAEEALRRTEQSLDQARGQAAKAGDELARERQARRAAEQEAERVGGELARLQAEVAALQQRLAAAEAELAQGGRAGGGAGAGGTPSVEAVVTPVVPAVAVDAAARARSAVQAAEAALAEVVAALADAGAAVAAASDKGRAADAGHATDDDAVERRAAARVRRAAGPRRRRRPAPLPPAVFDDTPEAADHLVRLPGAVLLVDGYNASLAYRPDLPIPELRRRLVDAVDELVARTGIDAHIVFDGADVDRSGNPMRAGGRRRSARVRFSPPDVEADDVILGMVDDASPDVPVVVASDDRRVQDGARDRGANVISTTQLLAALRRER